MKHLLAFISIWTTILVLITSGGCAPSDRSPASTSQSMAEGEVAVSHIDFIKEGRSETIITLREGGKFTRLLFNDDSINGLKTGMKVRVEGERTLDGFVVAEKGLTIVNSDQAQVFAQEVMGEQKTLVVPVNMNDMSVGCDAATMNNAVFGTSYSVDQFYRNMSHNQVWFKGSVSAPVKINANGTWSCDFNNWGALADAALQAKGINLSGYTRRAYVMPGGVGCGWAGLAYIGGPQSWVKTCENVYVYAHEFGHNLGMNHARANGDEYGDYTDVMGRGMGGINGPHREQMGWIGSGGIGEITSGGQYHVAPIELAVASSPQVYKVKKSDTSDYYYLSYVNGGLTLHRGSPYGGYTDFLKTVATGQEHTDSVNTIKFSAVSATPTALTFNVEFADGPIVTPQCTRVTPAISLSPTTQSSQAGGSLSYTVSVTNRDSKECAPSEFSLSGSFPYNFSGSLSVQSMTLSPGQSSTARFTVTSVATATAGNYGIGVSASDNATPGHASSAGGIYEVAQNPQIVLGTPTNFNATVVRISTYPYSKVRLTWMGATGAVKYRVYRNYYYYATTSNLYYVNTRLTRKRYYTYYVRAVDSAGRTSARSNIMKVYIP